MRKLLGYAVFLAAVLMINGTVMAQTNQRVYYEETLINSQAGIFEEDGALYADAAKAFGLLGCTVYWDSSESTLYALRIKDTAYGDKVMYQIAMGDTRAVVGALRGEQAVTRTIILEHPPKDMNGKMAVSLKDLTGLLLLQMESEEETDNVYIRGYEHRRGQQAIMVSTMDETGIAIAYFLDYMGKDENGQPVYWANPLEEDKQFLPFYRTVAYQYHISAAEYVNLYDHYPKEAVRIYEIITEEEGGSYIIVTLSDGMVINIEDPRTARLIDFLEYS